MSFQGACGEGAYLAADFRLRDAIIAVSDYDRRTIGVLPGVRPQDLRIYNPIALAGDGRLPRSPDPRGEHPARPQEHYDHPAFEALLDVFPHMVPGTAVACGPLMEYVSAVRSPAGVCRLPARRGSGPAVQDLCPYVNPSLSRCSGMTAVEAMIKGAPVLYDVAANREVTAGLLLRPRGTSTPGLRHEGASGEALRPAGGGAGGTTSS